MTITQRTLTLTSSLPGAKRAVATWDTGLTTPKLLGAVPVLPTDTNGMASPAVMIRANVAGAVVTVEATSLAPLGRSLDVLVSVDA